MSAAYLIEQFAATRAQLDSACSLLMEPSADALDRCSYLMESAGRQMAGCQSMLADAHGDAAALEEAWKVRRSFQRAGKLMENAARFHNNWMSIRGSMTGGYTDRGEPAPVRHTGRICVEG